jgi:hypothetical protein
MSLDAFDIPSHPNMGPHPGPPVRERSKTRADRLLRRSVARPNVTGRRIGWWPAADLQDRIEALKEKHAALELALDQENKRPLPNQDADYDLKRQKLRIKDEIKDEIWQLERH